MLIQQTGMLKSKNDDSDDHPNTITETFNTKNILGYNCR